MAQMNYRVSTLRAASCVSQDGAKKRMTSTDGLRWAISKNVKRSLGNRTFDIVEAWDLRERVNGKAVLRHAGRNEEAAIKWINNIDLFT